MGSLLTQTNSYQLMHKLILVCTFSLFLVQNAWSQLPVELQDRNQLTTYSEFTEIVKELDTDPLFTISDAGLSSEGRSLWLISIAEPKQTIDWRVFFYAQQHGNEPAGKEALINLAKSIQKNAKLLPRGVQLWLLPMVNPDGGEKDKRRNAVGADINRDHMTLEQPETIALHKAFRSIRPHVSIDCHEFGRDSDDYLSQGWIEWPEIMMDYANSPFLEDKIIQQGAALVARMEKAMFKKNIKFHRYFVGGVPPDGEQRFSAPDIDGGLNGAAMYGGLSFIIEAGVYRKNNEHNHDLPRRVYNYTELLFEVLSDKTLLKQARTLFPDKDELMIPLWAPTNYFWARLDQSIEQIQVIDKISHEETLIDAPNFMTELVIKKRVEVPEAYLVGESHAAVFEALLSNHGIPFTLIAEPIDLMVEYCQLDSIETEFDAIYHRYGGRAIVTRQEAKQVEVPAGSLMIPIELKSARKVVALLEPLMMYGLYQYPNYKELVDESGRMPVSRLISKSP